MAGAVVAFFCKKTRVLLQPRRAAHPTCKHRSVSFIFSRAEVRIARSIFDVSPTGSGERGEKERKRSSISLIGRGVVCGKYVLKYVRPLVVESRYISLHLALSAQYGV